MKHRRRQAKKSVQFGGLSFDTEHQPFASATGKEEMPMDDGLVSEPPWWLVGVAGLIGKLELYKQCRCPQADGGETTITDCPRLQKCDKCCEGRLGENYAGGGYDPMMASQSK